jgi:hypothetical protein
LKKVLIISPYFPPVNAADMQRVRTSLPYFPAQGWQPLVVMVDEHFVDMEKDPLLLQSVPANVRIIKVKAWRKNLTSKFGLGSLAIRSLYFYRLRINELLKNEHFDLVYFSTTQFPLCILGPYWQKKFNIPYVIDIQDPWHSDYYQNKPKGQRPRKYWFSYRLNKYLEPIAINKSSGLISVSEPYIATLKQRYPGISKVPAATITFGAFAPDLKIAEAYQCSFPALLETGFTNIVYIGRGGNDLHKALNPVFAAFARGLKSAPSVFSKLKFHFIGTSYAPKGKGIPTILPLAEHYDIGEHVVETTGRVGYYHALATLQKADALFIPGSDDPKYTASKIYPYLLLNKPLLAVFNQASSAARVLKESTLHAHVLTFDDTTSSQLESNAFNVLNLWAAGDLVPAGLTEIFDNYSAELQTAFQAELFNQALQYFEATNNNH